MCGGIILVIGIAGVTIHAEAIVLSGNGFPRNNRIFVTLFHMPPSIIIVVILYPALNIVVADPSITEMEPKIYVNQYTIGGLNYRTCIECFDNESVWCILQTPTDGFAEQNGRVAEPADCYKL